MKESILIFVFILGSLVLGCSHKSDNPPLDQEGSSNSDSEPTEQPEAISLVRDQRFEKGLLLHGINSSAPQTNTYIYPYGGEGDRPAWVLSEWASKHPIGKSDLNKQDGVVKYENAGKLVSFEHDRNTTIVNLDVTASNEYDHPRTSDEFWIHLLLEQEFVEKPALTDIDKLILTFEGRLTHEELKMSESEFNTGLHTAQFQLFLTIQDLKPGSPGYGDFLWFGVPFYDYRYDLTPQSDAPDIGTGKYIYGIGNEPFTNRSFKSKEWIKVELDLKPYILKGLQTAREHDFLKRSPDRNFQVSGFNLGWEVPGTIDVGFEFRNFDVKYISVEK